MKLLLITLLCIALLAVAQAAPPPIYPGETGSDSAFPSVRFLGPDCAVVWFYDVGHKWQRAGFWGSGDNCQTVRPELVSLLGINLSGVPAPVLSVGMAANMFFMTHAEKDAMWNAVFSIPATDPRYAENYAANVAADVGAKQLFNAVPVPTTIPPSGLVTQDVKAYKLSTIGIMSLVGTVALGVSCDATLQINGLYRVDRTKVKYPKGVLMPIATYVNCSP